MTSLNAPARASLSEPVLYSLCSESADCFSVPPHALSYHRVFAHVVFSLDYFLALLDDSNAPFGYQPHHHFLQEAFPDGPSPLFYVLKLFILLLHDPYHRCVYLQHPSINVCVFHSVVSFSKIGICGHFCSPSCLWHLMQCSAHSWS